MASQETLDRLRIPTPGGPREVLDEAGVPAGMADAHGLGPALLLQALQGEQPDGLQELEADATTRGCRRPGPQQRVVDQSLQCIQDVAEDTLGRGQPEGTVEDGQVRQDPLVRLREQVPGGLQGCPQARAVGRTTTGPGGQAIEALVQSLDEIGGAEQVGPRRGQLQGQRQTLQAGGELIHGLGLHTRAPVGATRLLPTIQQQGPGRSLGQGVQADHAHGRHLRQPTGGQDPAGLGGLLQPGAQQRIDGLLSLLGLVEHEGRGPATHQGSGQALVQVVLAPRSDLQDPGDHQEHVGAAGRGAERTPGERPRCVARAQPLPHQAGLAHTRRADDRGEATGDHRLPESLQVFRAPEEAAAIRRHALDGSRGPRLDRGGRLEAIAQAEHGQDVVGLPRIGLDLQAQPTDRVVHRAGDDVGVVAPDDPQQLVPVHLFARPRGQVLQQPELQGGEPCPLARSLDHALVEVDVAIAESEGARQGTGLLSAERSLTSARRDPAPLTPAPHRAREAG